jgi:hypothetical protein
MATTEKIYDAMASAASQEAALADLSPNPDTTVQLRSELSSGSRVSVWRLFMWLFAYAAKTQQDLWELYEKDVVALAKDGHFGTRRWFVAKAKAFQLGHVLVMTPLDGGYAVDDPVARIVTHAAVQERANSVYVKVAKGGANGTLAKLDPTELSALSDYFQHLRPTVHVVVLTADPDMLRVTGRIIYDPETPIMAVQSGVKLAMEAYLRSLEFGGIMRTTDLIQAVLTVPGVVDMTITDLAAKSTGPFRPVGRLYHTYAGHMILDTFSSLISTITWQQGRV